ncbi:MAG: RNA methyltransferase [Leeuwenhoekiella sp.]
MPRKLKNSELDRKSVEAFKEAKKTPIVVVLDNIRSLNNVGSVFRTADAFLIEKVILCGITATPPHRDITKTALGATETVDWEYEKEASVAVEKLKAAGFQTLAIEQAENSVMLNDFKISAPYVPAGREAKYAVIFGNEVKGVQQNVVSACDTVLEIPQEGTKHSLNIAVSAGVVLWDLYAKLKK